MSKDEDFNWLEDAFDDKKHAHDLEKLSQKKGAMTALLIGVIAVAALLVFAFVSILMVLPG